jgi:membrane-bound hydrogenase subunit mbhJ
MVQQTPGQINLGFPYERVAVQQLRHRNPGFVDPRYDLERLGIKLVGSIRHADFFAGHGIFNQKVAPKLKRIYEQAPKPIFVVAIGTCPASGCCFKDSYNAVAKREDILPIDLYIPGCPPKPEAMIEGVAKLVEVLNG